MKKTFFQKIKLPLLISVLVSICVAYFFVDKIAENKVIEEKPKIELDTVSQLIDEDTTGLYKLPFLIYQKNLDTLIIRNEHEFLHGGNIYCNTLRDTTKLSNFLLSYFGKPHSYNTGAVWQNVEIEKKGKYWVEMYLGGGINSDHFSIHFTITDEKRNLVQDTTILNFFKEIIHQQVFTQPRIIKSNSDVKELRYQHYKYSYLMEFEPTNFSEIRNKMYQDSIFSTCELFDLQCVVNTMGKIEEFESENKDTLCIKKLDKYISQFQYPILFLDSTKQERVKYKINLIIKDSTGRELAKQDTIKNQIELLNNPTKEFKEYLKNQPDYFICSMYFKNKNGQKIGFLYHDGKDLFYFSKKSGKWKFKQSFEIEGEGIETNDLNKDGIEEISLFTGRNMNANSWCNLFVYDQKGDSLVVAAEGIINPLQIHKYWQTFSCEDSEEYVVKKNTLIKYHFGSWYMPAYTEIYHWKNNKLVLKAVFGTELVHEIMTDQSIPTFFAYQIVNNSLQLTHQFVSTDETNKQECRVSEEIFKKYNK